MLHTSRPCITTCSRSPNEQSCPWKTPQRTSRIVVWLPMGKTPMMILSQLISIRSGSIWFSAWNMDRPDRAWRNASSPVMPSDPMTRTLHTKSTPVLLRTARRSGVYSSQTSLCEMIFCTYRVIPELGFIQFGICHRVQTANAHVSIVEYIVWSDEFRCVAVFPGFQSVLAQHGA